MSSMLRLSSVLILLAAASLGQPVRADDGREWDQAKLRNSVQSDPAIGQAIVRWKTLTTSDQLGFQDYAQFLLKYPGFPSESKLQANAEKALERESPDAKSIIAFFEKFPPISNQARARYALALASLNYPGAREMAVTAWREGTMSEVAEATLSFRYGDTFTRADHDARMDALLWQGATSAAERQIAHVSPTKRDLFMERLSLLKGNAPGGLGVKIGAEAMSDPGYVFNRVRQARTAGNIGTAISLLIARPPLARPVYNAEAWVKELLTAARAANPDSAVRIATSIDDAFAPGTDISQKSYRLRDDYTSLMWLGGTSALWTVGDPKRAAPLFYRYGAAAQTPGTRSKGFYWAGRALSEAGDPIGAARYFEMAAEYPDHFYGMLSLERLGREMPKLGLLPAARPTKAERDAFMAKPLTRAVREVANGYIWSTTVRFFREIADQADTEAEHMLVADLAREIGRRDLAVILGQEAHTDGYGNFHQTSFPLIPTPIATDWTMVHAISRQESQFAQNAISHAGARGLMQLMPGTAKEQAGKMGLGYDPGSLIGDADYNIRLGNGYFSRMMDYYGGTYPLAVGAYNAGPGNVNKWLRANGDPRTGSVDWVTWIERIPIYETKNYIQKVLENAVVYEALYPERATLKRGKNPLSHFLGKRTPG